MSREEKEASKIERKIRIISKIIEGKDSDQIINVFELYKHRPKEERSSIQSVIYEILLKLPRDKFDSLFEDQQKRNRLKELLPNHNIWNIRRYYNWLHAVSDKRLHMTRYETDEGRLFQIQFEGKAGNKKTINFTRNYSLGSERVLSADPISMSADEWKMFVDRGHGLYATSIITRVIATLGTYIAEVERAYDLQPIKDPVTGQYFLSENDMAILKERDPNAFAKYQVIRTAQEELRGLYERERNVDPNHPDAQRDFKHGISKILGELRGALYQQKQADIDHMPKTSDHILADAQEQVNHFEWPNDSKGARFKITEADQLIAKRGERITYDPSKEPSSAAGASVFGKTLSGMGEMGRDNFAHCLTLMDYFNRTQRTAFMQAVQKLKPSEGLRLEATSKKDRAKEMEAKRMALSILKEASEHNGKVKDVFQKSIEFFDTKTGRDLCERELGCGSGVFKAQILYEMVVHAPDALFVGAKDLLENEGRKYLQQISDEKEKQKPDKQKMSLLESVVVKLYDLENKAVEKRDKRAKEGEKIKSLFEEIKEELKRLEKASGKESPEAQVAEFLAGDSKNKKTSELRNIHAELIGRYGSGAEDVDEFRERLNRFSNKYSEGFCVEVLGTSKSDFIELVMQKALKNVGVNLLNDLEAFYKKKGGGFLDLIENAKKRTEKKSVRDVSDRIISRKPDPLLEAKAKEIAEQALIKENPIDFIKNAAKERMPHQEKRLIASALYRYALKCDQAQFDAIKNELSSLISPYHDVSNIVEIRGLLTDVKNAKTNGDQAALDQAMQQLNPRLLNPDRQTGEVFLRTGLMGFTYKLIDPIVGVLEEIGVYDPIRGTLALGVMGLGIGYVMAAHGAAVAASAAHSKLVSALNNTYLIPEVYKNVVVLTPHVGTGKTVLAGLVDGITLGKVFYLLSSASDMAVSGRSSGFSGRIIAGIMNNPIETMVLVTLMTALGQGIVVGLHEQAAMGGGGWRLMGGFFEALKGADIGYHGILEVMKIVSDDAARSPEGLQHPEDIKALYAGMLAQKLFSSMTPQEQKQFPMDDLKEKFDNAFKKINIKNVGEFNKLSEYFLKEFDEKERGVIENKLKVPETAPQLSKEQNNVIDAIKTKFNITAEKTLDKLSADEQIRYGLCVQEGLALLAQNSALSGESIAVSVTQQLPKMETVSRDYQPLYQKMRERRSVTEKPQVNEFFNISAIDFLKKLYPEESAAFNRGFDLKNDPKALEIHQKVEQDYLTKFFIKELLTEKSKDSVIWKTIFNDPKLQAHVEKIAGVSWASLRDQEVPKFRTAGEKIADVAKAAVPSATANVEGFGKFMNLVMRLPAKISGVVGTAMIRGATMFAMVAKSGLGRAEANYNRAGQEAARVVTGTIGKYTTARPDGVSQWRRSFSSPQLRGKAKPLGNENLYFRLINWVNPIMKNPGNDFFNKLGQQLEKPYSKGSQEEQLVDLLNPLFPSEVKTLKKMLSDQQIPEKEKNSYMLAALQELCHDEMMMCSKEERVALEKNPSLVQMIAGESIDFSKMHDDVVTATSKKVQEATQQACDTIFYTATATREDVLGKQAIPAYRLSSNKIGDLFSNLENRPPVEVSKSLLMEKLQEIVNEYTKTKSVLGFDSHLIKSLRVALKTMPENADGNKAALHVLSTLFPVEFRQIEQKMMAQGTPDNQRESVKLHVLQAIMKNELDAAATKSKTAFAAYSTVLNHGDRGLCQLLTGKERVGFISESHHLPSVVVSQQPVASNKPAEDSVSKPSPKPHSP